MEDLTLESGLRDLRRTRYEHVHVKSIAAIKSNVSNPVPYFLLGVLAYDHKNFSKAEELFKKAATLDPEEAHYPAYLARLSSELRRPEAAEEAANIAAGMPIHDGYLADMIGVVFSRTGFHERARDCFQKAVKLNSAQPNFFYNLGASELFLGNFGNAKIAFQSATALDPNHFGAWASLIALDKQTVEANHLDHLMALHTKFKSDEDAAHQLAHAIAKTLEDLGRYEESLEWLHIAKSEKHKKYGYDRESGQKNFDAAKATATIRKGGHRTDTTTIFVMGLPRTGTTLVDRILSSHSKVKSAGELNFFAELIKSETGTPSNLVLDAETFAAAENVDLAKIGKTYLERVENRMGPHDYVVDKMPFNFFYASLIAQALPNARLIALRRGAMDSCLSNFRQLLSVQNSFYNYTFDLDDTAFFYRQFDSLMERWREALPSDRFMEIHYENIVQDQENQTRQLLSFCGLDFEEACLTFHENAAPVSTASSVQVRQPLYSDSIGRWKKYGDRLEPLKTALGPLAD